MIKVSELPDIRVFTGDEFGYVVQDGESRQAVVLFEDANGAVPYVDNQLIENHGDVVLTNLTSGQVLAWSGTEWINVDQSGGGGPGLVSSVFGRIGDVIAVAGDYTAAQVNYDNLISGLTSTDVQGALDELKVLVDAGGGGAVDSVFGRTGVVVAEDGDYAGIQITYDNTSSGLTSTTVQGAIDDLDTVVDGIVDDITNGVGVVTSFNTREGAVVPTDGDYTAIQVTYDNTTGLTSTDVQGAIDELKIIAESGGAVDSVFGRTGVVVAEFGDYDASLVEYDNSSSGLPAANTQAAIDQLDAKVDDLESGTGVVTSFNTREGDVLPAASDYDAVQVDYDGTTSGLTSVEVQGAIDEIKVLVDDAGDYPVDTVFGRTGNITAFPGDYTASHITYDNSTSGLTATTSQGAIDEIEDILDDIVSGNDVVLSFNTRVGDVVPANGDYTSLMVSYDSTSSGLPASTAQAAIDALDTSVDSILDGSSAVISFNTRLGDVLPLAGDYNALQVTYDNTTSGLTAVDTQGAIDELDATVDTILDDINNGSGVVNSFNGREGSVIPEYGDYSTYYADKVHEHVKADITDFNEDDYATGAEGDLAVTALQPGDNISELTNDIPYLTADTVPHQLSEANPTGLADGGELNIIGGTDIQVTAGTGVIVDSYTDPISPPVTQVIMWESQSQPIVTTATPGAYAFFTMSPAGVLTEYSVRPPQNVVRDEIMLGIAIYDGAAWGEVSSPTVVNNTAHTVEDFLNTVVGPTTTISGGIVSEQPAFQLSRESGVVWEMNRNWHVDKKDPHREAFAATPNFSWRYVNQFFDDVSAATNTVDPTLMDIDGVVQPLPQGNVNRCTIQRLYVDPRDNYWVLWGQTMHDNFQEAVARIGVDTATAIIPPLLRNGSQLLGYIVVEQGQSDWAEEDARFVPESAIGSGGGGGGIGDVPDDGILYGRKFEVWEPAATQSQGLLADTALQPGDNISELVNDVPYLTLGTLPDDLVTSVHGRVGDVIGESGDYDASLITYSNTNSGLTATQVQGALDEIELDKIDRMMFWEDEWVAGTYGKNAVVRDGPWTMIANTQTSQVPHPVEVGTPENTFPETPAFATQSAEGVIVSGSDFVFTHDVYVTSIRVWVPAVNNDTVYNFVYENVTSGEITTTSGLSLVSNSWNVVSTKSHQALVGDNHRVYIESENTNPGTTITGSWAFQPDNNEPDDGNWSHETEADLYIDRQDSSGTDRSSELENLVTGAIIRFENPGDPSTYKEYTATSDAARIGTSYVMTATLTGSTIGDFIEDELTDMTAIIPAVTPTEYSEISGYWTTNSPTTWANISGILEIDGVPASAPNDGFGVDIEVQLVEIPTDWDLVAYSADGDTGSGSGGSVFADGDFAIKGSVDDTKEMVFDVSNISPGNIRTLFTPDLDGEILVSGGDQDVLGLKHFQTGLGVGSSDSNFFVDTVNSYVGINTATPGKALDIRGGAGADVEFRVISTDQQANMILDGLSPSSTGLVGELSFRNSGDSICILSCRTDGAPDDGRFDFRTQSGGSMTSQMLLDSTGQLYLLNLDGTGSGSSMRFDTGSGQLRYDTSSIRHKENVRPDTFTSWIHDLDVVTYDRKDGSRMNEVGIIAEQMASCCTDTITYNKAGEIEGYNKEDMVPYLLKEIQILKIELDALKAKLEE